MDEQGEFSPTTIEDIEHINQKNDDLNRSKLLMNVWNIFLTVALQIVSVYLAYKIIKVVKWSNKVIVCMLIFMNLTMLTNIILFSIEANKFQKLLGGETDVDEFLGYDFFNYIML